MFLGSVDDATTAPAMVQKYNRFVDSIFGKINRILGRSYDPVKVHLTNFEAKNNRAKQRQRCVRICFLMQEIKIFMVFLGFS